MSTSASPPVSVGTLPVQRQRALCFFLSFVLFVVCCAPRAQSAEFHGRALIVGVNTYLDPNVTPLRYSVPDAHLLADLLTDKERSIFPRDKVRLLTEDAATDDRKPNRLNILEGIQWLSEAEPDETILFYFSGHGVLSDQGKQYLACRDLKLTALPFTAVPVDDVNGILNDPNVTKSRRIIVIFDSCHSGTRVGAKAIGTESGRVIEKLMSQGDGRVTLASCQAEEQSFEDPETGHGVFTYYLAEGLRGAADTDRDGTIGAMEANLYVYDKVTAWAKEHGNKQTPRYAANVTRDITLSIDPVRWNAENKAKSDRIAGWKALREVVSERSGRDANDLGADETAVLMAALDRLITGKPEAADSKLAELAGKYSRNEMKAEALRAEIKVMGAATVAAAAGTAPPPLKVQLFQPQWEAGATPDEFEVKCQPGDEISIVGLAESPACIARVLLDGEALKLTSLGSKDLQVVRKAEPGTNMRFEGTLKAGTGPSAAVLTVFDTGGNHRLIVLRLKTEGAVIANAGARPRRTTVAVVGINKRGVDQYDDLKALRVGLGLHNLLTRSVRDTGRFTLVEEKTDVVRGLVEMQWVQQKNIQAFDQQTAVAAGKLMGAKYVLYGEMYDFASPKENKGRLFAAIEVRLVNVETAQYIPGFGEAEMKLPKAEPGDLDFDRSSLSKVSRAALQAALEDIFKAAGASLNG